MNYTDYLKQQAQQTQEPQEEAQPQPAQTLEQIAAQLAAEKYYSLQAETRRIVPFATDPAALAANLVDLILGPGSFEAGCLANLIAAQRQPGGYELAIDAIQQRRRTCKKQMTRLAEMQKELSADIEQLIEEERSLTAAQSDAAQYDAAMLDIMPFRPIAAEADAEALLLQGGNLLEKHSSSRQAMCLLYGIIHDQQNRLYADGAADLVQRQAMNDLLARIAASAGMT